MCMDCSTHTAQVCSGTPSKKLSPYEEADLNIPLKSWRICVIIEVNAAKWTTIFPQTGSNCYKMQPLLLSNWRGTRDQQRAFQPQFFRGPHQWPPGSVFRVVPKQSCRLMEMWGICLSRTRRRLSNPTPPTPQWTRQSAQTGNILLFQKNGKIRNTRVSDGGTHVQTWFDEVTPFCLALFSSCQH